MVVSDTASVKQVEEGRLRLYVYVQKIKSSGELTPLTRRSMIAKSISLASLAGEYKFFKSGLERPRKSYPTAIVAVASVPFVVPAPEAFTIRVTVSVAVAIL